MYLAALVERGIEYDIDDGSSNKYKKHLRSLLSRDIPDIEFRQPPARNKSAFVALKSIVSKMVDTTAKSKIDSPAMYDLCKTLRYEVMQFRDWNFTGDFSSWENPPVLEYVIKQIMLGPNYIKLDKQRKADAQKSVDIVCQVICQNSKSDRQVNYKTQAVFKQKVQTPLSVGAPMCVHARFRDYHLVNNLSDLYIGNDYRKLMDLEKRIQYAVIDRVNKTGHLCIPDFARKGVHCWFAVDNIDFLECTAYGQYTLHGCLIIMFQKSEYGDIINPPLKIPDKLPKDCLKIKLQHKPEPELRRHPVKFDQFSHDFAPQAAIEKYFRFTQTWALSSIAGNERFGQVPTRLQKVVPSDSVDTPDDETDSNEDDGEIEEQVIPDELLPEQHA